MILLRPRERLRSIVMSTSVCVCMCVCLSARIFQETHAQSLPKFLYVLPVAMARSSIDGQGTKRRRKIAANFNWLSRLHQRYRRQIDGTAIAYSERERKFTFAKMCLSLVTYLGFKKGFGIAVSCIKSSQKVYSFR